MTDVFGRIENAVENAAVYSPRGKVVDITPQMAENALKFHNAKNPRKRINMNTARAYARDMSAGKWLLNGEAIVIDNDGNIKDGQHRLMGIAMSGVTVKSLVVTGVDPAITTFDMGMRRKIQQEIGCGAAVETLATAIVSNIGTYNAKASVTVRDYMIAHMDEINKALTMCNRAKVGSSALCSKRDVYTTIYVMMRNGFDEDELSRFVKAVNSGFPVEDRDCSACVVLANYLRTHTIHSVKSEMLYTMEVVYLAYCDFANRNKRVKPYKPQKTDDVWEMVQRVRKMDGLE